ncbi:spore gernimation protein GerD [Jeotgalibacillus sp. S-D1]|uniref:spore germination lipoprotein GerD n=1 Tax=Jeotgalibacillus sp. S-D1 TaxID=2552189 RepID=UPI0010598378|nr:spore germination lipoprotein GerD [Jeotgalibacillus sp. S-D1]TDL30515.1 spore gernimation protein GerD [Jeotgalibacillus sp. S-D1]
MKRIFTLSAGLILLLMLSGCGGGEKAPSYEETKQMFIDLLKTNEGKKAIQELLADEAVKKELVLDQKVVTDSIDTTLLSEEGKKFWEKSFKDPAFAEVIAKSMQKENQELLKDLMKDPEYQKMMLELLKDPSIQEQTLTLLNSQTYREETKKLMMEVMESPLVQKQMQDILLEAAQKMGQEEGSGGGEGPGPGPGPGTGGSGGSPSGGSGEGGGGNTGSGGSGE